jgi:hypothetical protein
MTAPVSMRASFLPSSTDCSVDNMVAIYQEDNAKKQGTPVKIGYCKNIDTLELCLEVFKVVTDTSQHSKSSVASGKSCLLISTLQIFLPHFALE